jgi:hypothetical protein
MYIRDHIIVHKIPSKGHSISIPRYSNVCKRKAHTLEMKVKNYDKATIQGKPL